MIRFQCAGINCYLTARSKALCCNQKKRSSGLKVSLPFYYYDVANLELNAAHHAATSMSVDAFKGSAQCQWNKTNLMSRLGEIRVPTLVVVGSHDFICSPLHAHRLHMGIACSKLILIEKAGHFSWFEQPDQFFSKVKEGLAAVQ